MLRIGLIELPEIDKICSDLGSNISNRVVDLKSSSDNSTRRLGELKFYIGKVTILDVAVAMLEGMIGVTVEPVFVAKSEGGAGLTLFWDSLAHDPKEIAMKIHRKVNRIFSSPKVMGISLC